MKKFKKIIAMGLAVLSVVSAMSVNVMAAEDVAPLNDVVMSVEDGDVAPAVSYYAPSNFLDISSRFTDTFNGFHTNAFSDFYFNSGIRRKVYFSINNNTTYTTQPNSRITIRIVERLSDGTAGNTIDTFYVDSDSNGDVPALEKVINFDYQKDFFIRFSTPVKADGTVCKVYGSYTIVQG